MSQIIMTINEIIGKHSSSNSENIALLNFFNPKHNITYGQLDEYVKKFGVALSSFGVTRQSRVGIVLPNGINISLALLGTSSTAISVPLSFKMTEKEYLYYLECSKCSHLIIQVDNFPDEVISAARKLDIKIIQINETAEILNSSIKQIEAPSTYIAANANDIAIIFLTSGSTGTPKIVPLTHLNVCTAAVQVANSLNLTSQDRCLCMWEQYHIGGFVDLLLAPIYSGGLVICAGKFDTNIFFSALTKVIPTWFQGVPTTLIELLKFGKNKSIQKNSLRFIRSVAAALPSSHMMDIENYFNVPVIQTFGMTEASPLITTNELPPGSRKPGSVGKSFGTEVVIMDSKNNYLPKLTHGEIAIKGDNVFRGYESNPQANSIQFSNGWFFTGDIGYFDNEGFLFLTGRSKELVNKGGEKVSPYEIEEVLNKHPSISESAIFSVPHNTLGEDIAAAIVFNENKFASSDELKIHVSKFLSEFKIPTTFLSLTKLPRNNIGKILRSELKEIYENRNIKKIKVEPQNSTQKLLLQIWSAEIHNELISVDDDFQELGGDSLALTRILSIIEEFFGIELSEHSYLDMNSIEKMSKIIESTQVNSLARKHIPNLKKALYENSFLKMNEHSDFDAIITSLKNKNSLQEFINFRESLLTYSTPHELKIITNNEFLNQLPRKILDNHFVWSKSLSKELDTMQKNQSWSRKIFGSHSFLYQSQDSNNENLIVALTGSAGRLMMPIYRFLLNLNPSYDLLLIQIPESGHYNDGIPGHGNDLRSFSQWVYDNFHNRPYKKIMTFGVSAGALPSLCMNITRPFDKIVLVAPEIIDAHPKLKNELANNLDLLKTVENKINLVFSEKNNTDQLAISQLTALLNNPNKLILKNSTSHLVLHEIWKKGLLRKFLSTLFH